MNEHVNTLIDISIIIPNYNSTDKLLTCLNTIFNQRTKYNYEVIVIDSSDQDPTQRLKKSFPGIEIVHFDGRVYPGTARNSGVQKARGQIIAFTDADCIVDSQWIDNFCSAQNGTFKAIGGSVKNGLKRHVIASAEYMLEFSEFLPHRKKGIISILPTCNFIIEKEIFDKIGGFKNLITAEDTLFSHEVMKMGHQMLFDPEISITHFNRKKFSTFMLKQKELGMGSCLLRKRINVSGSWLIKKRVFSLLIPILRSITTFKKIIQFDSKLIFHFIVLYPFIFLGLIAYTAGFWKAYVMKHEP